MRIPLKVFVLAVFHCHLAEARSDFVILYVWLAKFTAMFPQMLQRVRNVRAENTPVLADRSAFQTERDVVAKLFFFHARFSSRFRGNKKPINQGVGLTSPSSATSTEQPLGSWVLLREVVCLHAGVTPLGQDFSPAEASKKRGLIAAKLLSAGKEALLDGYKSSRFQVLFLAGIKVLANERLHFEYIRYCEKAKG